jgi:NADPH:quinone reductase-like Zn-dependent oxidoreductase
MSSDWQAPTGLKPIPISISSTARGETMRAIVHRKYGPPDVLQHEDVERPVPEEQDVLVRVCAAGVSVGDYHVVTGTPYLIRLSPFGGFPRPKNLVPGTCMSGRVEAVGARVSMFRPGDEVYGQAPAGAFAEYVVVPADLIAPKPNNLSFEEAAATPWAFPALQGLRDAGGLKSGQKVLINGASGGVGTWAVQIAKALGGHVTAVCSARNVEMVRALGADQVIDYTKVDFAEGGARFDLMLDAVGNRSISDCRSVVVPEGAFVSCSGGRSATRWLVRLLWMKLSSPFTNQKLVTLAAIPNQKDLLFLTALVEAGKAKPVIERRYSLNQVPEALRTIGRGHTPGQSVIQVVSWTG